ncbi:MAG: hypothetical protein WD623_02735 [Marinobacter sp.]|uniref:Nmad2 family putative nucleotide modification protein n=1 Tax=Marinobacter sp. TaxID=50741 RepID=UPI0034A00081
MLIDQNSRLYIYAITRDYGFAPNPFFGVCTLATCKPRIRKQARVGDWILGVGGAELQEHSRKAIFLMRVSEKTTFQNYWNDSRFANKKPLRNGSKVRMVGDNIYHKDMHGDWLQEDSHHSNADGTVNQSNLKRDTGETSLVLISDYFIYFGSKSREIDLTLLDYKRIRDYRKLELNKNPVAFEYFQEFLDSNSSLVNMIMADPCDFESSSARVDQKTGAVT